MEKVKWYRNSSEKDQDKPKGKGTIVAVKPMHNNSGGSAVIVDEDGNFIEKELSLIKVDKEPPVDTTALQNELDKTVEANKKLSDDLNAVQEKLNKLISSSVEATVKAADEIKDLKAKLTATKPDVKEVKKTVKPVKK